MQVGPGSNEQFIINTTFSPPVCGGVRSQQGDLLEVGALLAISLIPWLNGLSPCALLVLDLGCALIQFSFLGSPQSSIIHHPSSISITHHPSSTIHHPSSIIHAAFAYVRLFVRLFFFLFLHLCAYTCAIEGKTRRARGMTTGADDEHCRSSTQDTSLLRWRCLTGAASTHRGAFSGISLFTLS
jgi:hypothetical protein